MKKHSAHKEIKPEILKALKQRAKAEGKSQTRVIKDYFAALAKKNQQSPEEIVDQESGAA